MRKGLFLLLTINSLVCSGQIKELIKDYPLTSNDVKSRHLKDLETDTSGIFYRIWVQPDLVIEVGNKVSLTVYLTEYSKAQRIWSIKNLEKYKVDTIHGKELIAHMNNVGLGSWTEGTTEISDGNRIIIEFSSKQKYRIFSLYGPVTDQSVSSKTTLELINYLDSLIKPDRYRLRFYRELSRTDKTAKYRVKSIETYFDSNKERIKNKILPTMWGAF